MIRTVHVEEITKNIKEMCIEANHYLSEDMDVAMKQAVETEKAPLGKQILTQLQENLQIAAKDMIPICQDTGMAVIFLEIGQDVHFEGGSLEDAVNEGVRQGLSLIHIFRFREMHRERTFSCRACSKIVMRSVLNGRNSLTDFV